MAFTEVPTGAVAETIGRKHSMFIGVILSILAIPLFALAPTYPLLLIANSLWSIAITFISGVDMALDGCMTLIKFPIPLLGLQGTQVHEQDHLIEIYASSVQNNSVCPDCNGLSTRVQNPSPDA